MVILGSRRSWHCILGQHDNAVVTLANAYLVLGTNHAVRLDAAQLAFLYRETLVAVVELGAQRGNDHLLPCLDIGRAAYDLFGFTLSEVDGADVHVVAVGMGLAGQHLADDDAFQTALDALYFLHAIDLQSYAGQGGSHFLSSQVEIDILAKPFIRNIHKINLLFDDLQFTIYLQFDDLQFTVYPQFACKDTNK